MLRIILDKLISIIILLEFLVVGILYQFNIIAEHYVFGWISYALLFVAFVISLLKNDKLRNRIISLASSVVVLIIVLLMHFSLINNPYAYRYQEIDGGVEITKGVYRISNYYSPSTKNKLIIPDKINGKDVKVIGAKSFAGINDLLTVVIPDSVEVIEEYAFYNTNISYLKLSNNVKVIESYSFNRCQLRELTLPNSLETIGDYAFEFSDLQQLRYVNVPKNVKSIGLRAFRFAQVIAIDNKEISGDYKNWIDGPKIYHEAVAYKYNGIIYVLHTDKTATVARIDYKESEISILDKIIYNNEEYIVTTIAEKAGYYCKFEEIVIPNTVTTIKYNAFANNEKLIKIYIPNSVIYMEENIFFESLNVKIYVEHSEKPEGWNENWNGDSDKREVSWNAKSN